MERAWERPGEIKGLTDLSFLLEATNISLKAFDGVLKTWVLPKQPWS